MELDVARFDAALRAGKLAGLALEIHDAGVSIRATAELFSDYATWLKSKGRVAEAQMVSDENDAILGALGGRMNPRLVAGFEDALRGGTLVGFAEALHRAGLKKQEIMDRFSEFAFRLRAPDRERDLDACHDVMDLLCGWCDPGARLFPDEPDAE